MGAFYHLGLLSISHCDHHRGHKLTFGYIQRALERECMDEGMGADSKCKWAAQGWRILAAATYSVGSFRNELKAKKQKDLMAVLETTFSCVRIFFLRR